MPVTILHVFYVSIIFVFFYNLKQDSAKIRLLLIGSLAFYFYHEAFLTPLLIAISLLAYLAGYLIERFSSYKRTIIWLFFIILTALYFPFKYNLSFEKLSSLLFNFEGLRWLYLPLGLSFYTYKTMSYVFDIYYERSVHQKSIEKYLLFVSYFPQIFCGPIMGPDEFFSQLKFKEFNLEEVLEGLRLLVIGVFKKLVLANNLVLLIQSAYLWPQSVWGSEWILISIISRFYIYYDFSGYSDISNGVSLLFGIKVQKNFDLPFKSKSITEFWRRWHISLSSWLRDYVYYPLVSKFSSYAGIYISLVISFVFLGLWHGDQLNYILYGTINGIAVAISTYNAKRNRNKKPAGKGEEAFSILMLYLFLIFLPALLLMSHNSATMFTIFKSFGNWDKFFDFNYFQTQNVSMFAYLMIPVALIFEIILVFYGKTLRETFSSLSLYQKILVMLVGVFITYTLISPVVNYRFLYQSF